MWAYFCWLQISWVCRLILKTMPSCPGLTPILHSTIGLTAGYAECSLIPQWKASHGGHRHSKEKTFSKTVKTFSNNDIQWLFFVWWHLTTLRWTGRIPCTLPDIMWLLIFRSLPDICQIWAEVIWLTPAKGNLISALPISWEQIQPSPEVSEQPNYNNWKKKWNFCLKKYAR